MKNKKITLALCLMSMIPMSSFANANYWSSGSGLKVHDGSGQCVRSGSWSASNGLVEGCDPIPKKVENKVVVVPPVHYKKPVAPVEKESLFIQQQEVVYEELIHFEFNESTLTANAMQRLDELVHHEHQGSLVEVVVTGHADRIGSDDYNMTLSQHRALSVRNYLVSKGVERLKITLDAKGEHEPLVMCEGKMKRQELIECLSPNRRAEVTVRIFE